MTRSALDRTCEKYGCAKIALDPKLHAFDGCFGGKIRMGDVDGAVERNGHILWVEWKNGCDLQSFEKIHMAQIIQAKAFTNNSRLQTYVFVIGDPVQMKVERFRVMVSGEWQWPWQEGGIERLKSFFKWWFDQADKRAAA
jgi:hypothetical protein